MTELQEFLRRVITGLDDFKKGLKADSILLKDREFGKVEFGWVASAEDVILSKLEWSKLSDSERQYRDAMQVAATQHQTLDLNYLKHWAVQLKVEGLLDKLLAEIAKDTLE